MNSFVIFCSTVGAIVLFSLAFLAFFTPLQKSQKHRSRKIAFCAGFYVSVLVFCFLSLTIFNALLAPLYASIIYITASIAFFIPPTNFIAKFIRVAGFVVLLITIAHFSFTSILGRGLF